MEHGHRLIGATVGMISIGLVAVVWRSDSRRWLHWFSVAVLAMVVFQGILGGMRVLFDERTLAMLHGCSIGEGSLIGIKAVVLNHARIGRQCIIGANALVTEGKEIPDRSLVVGSPGRVVRQLTDEEVQFVLWNAAHYVEKLRRYRSALEPQA